MKKDKELIDFIVDKLKNSNERSYREGAWEKFKTANSLPAASVSRVRKMWYAAAAVLFLVGLGAVWFMTLDTATVENQLAQGEYILKQQDQPSVDDLRTDSSPGTVLPKKDQEDRTESYADLPDKARFGKTSASSSSGNLKDASVLAAKADVNISADIHVPTILPLQTQDLSKDYSTRIAHMESLSRSELDKHLALGTPLQGATLAIKEVEPQVQNRRIPLNNRFELGLFVSPYATSQKMNVGGGFMLAYKLTKKISVRTGASYNTYEVNTMKNPLEESSVEAVVAESDVATESMKSFSSYQQQVIIPNINAVTGFVQSIDIPLELKLHATKSLYAVAGMSYSSILNQERNAYYVENVNTETFAKGYPETKEQATNAVKPVTKSIESTEKNVNTNGFTGFVNFSIGKDLRLNKNMGISLEPYLKIPVGQYRRADMDYTNGGIRIMTNF